MRDCRTVEADIHRGQWLDPGASRIPLGEYADAWLAQRYELRPRTIGHFTGASSPGTSGRAPAAQTRAEGTALSADRAKQFEAHCAPGERCRHVLPPNGHVLPPNGSALGPLWREPWRGAQGGQGFAQHRHTLGAPLDCRVRFEESEGDSRHPGGGQ